MREAKVGAAALVLVTLLALSACGPRPPGMPLLDAINQDNADVVLEHMEFGTDPDNTFIPPGAPFAGASALHLAVLKNNEEIVTILLDNGANIDVKARETFKGTPLDWAAFWGVRGMVMLLVEKDADVNSKNAVGGTPLDAAKADNPFVDKEDLEQFQESRAFIREYLAGKGGKPGAE